MGRVSIAAIKAGVSKAWEVNEEVLWSKRRAWFVAHPRFAAFKLARDLTPLSLPVIGRLFGRDHTTVMHGIKRAEALQIEDDDFSGRYRIAQTVALEYSTPVPETDPVWVDLVGTFRQLARLKGLSVRLEPYVKKGRAA